MGDNEGPRGLDGIAGDEVKVGSQVANDVVQLGAGDAVDSVDALEVAVRGGGLWWWFVVVVCGGGLWWWFVVVVCGGGLWWWFVVVVCGDGLWWVLVMVCGGL